MKNSMMILFALMITIGCNSQKSANTDEVTTASENKGKKDKKRQKPSIDDLFKMDANNDGMLSKSEVKGPILNDFEKIDTNNDGFLTRTEVENAPKPEKGQRGQRPPRGNQ